MTGCRSWKRGRSTRAHNQQAGHTPGARASNPALSDPPIPEGAPDPCSFDCQGARRRKNARQSINEVSKLSRLQPLDSKRMEEQELFASV